MASMIELEDIDTDDEGALTATTELPGGRRVTVQYDFDDDFDLEETEDEQDERDVDDEIDRENLPDIDEMQATVEHALARLSEEILDAIEGAVVRQVVEAIREDGEDEVADVAELSADIALDGVEVSGEGSMTLLYVAPETFPDTTVICLLDDDLDIEDLLVE